MSVKIDDLTITKGTGTVLTLNAGGKYVADNSFFNIDVRQGIGAVTVASTDASVESDASGRNISGVIGQKTTSAPATGYYLKVQASGTGESTITTAGWLDTGSMGTATATSDKYFAVSAAAAVISGTNTITPSASITGTNITLSNTNNGISVTATGGGSAAASASASSTQAGYVPSGETMCSGTINASSKTTTATSYISGVTLGIPASGTNTFAITLPNGSNDTITLTITVDTNGNWTIE